LSVAEPEAVVLEPSEGLGTGLEDTQVEAAVAHSLAVVGTLVGVAGNLPVQFLMGPQSLDFLPVDMVGSHQLDNLG